MYLPPNKNISSKWIEYSFGWMKYLVNVNENIFTWEVEN
jgi:hypothetical protein